MTTNTDYVLSVKIDNYCDYIPLVSTFKNIYNIYQKNVVIPSMTKPDLWKDRYYTHLDQKSYDRCIILLIPVLGNIIIAIYDLIHQKYDDKEYMLNAFSSWISLADASKRLQDDEDAAFAAICYNRNNLKHISKRLQANKPFILRVVQRYCLVFNNVSNWLHTSWGDDEDIVFAAVSQGDWLFLHASLRLQDNKNLVLRLIQFNVGILSSASERLRDDDDVIAAAIKKDPKTAMWYASKRLQRKYENSDPYFLPSELASPPECSPAGFDFLSKALEKSVNSSSNNYAILGLEEGASIEKVKKAFKALAVKVHPDKNTDKDQVAAGDAFKITSYAYEELTKN